jgi:hypothetical protein
MTLLVLAATGACVVIVWAVLSHAGRSAGSQQDADVRAGDFHGSNANFGNSLQGDNSNFGRGFYDE